MRRIALTCSVLGSLIAAGCAPGAEPESDGLVSESKNPIAYGTADTTHTAVVSLIIDAGGGSYAECSGSIVKVAGNIGYVLTAAHCCNMGAPGIVVMANDYGNYAQQLYNPNPSPPVYKVVAGSVYWDALYDQYSHDFCMLKFSGATATTPVLALPTGPSDGVTLGTALEHVGYGMTDTNPNNSQRRHGTNTANIAVNAQVLQYQQGNNTPGPCEGDSGGPALIPAGASPSTQTVVGVTSWGNSSSCAGSTMGTSSRVLSGIGAGKFITSFINDTPIGNQPGAATGNCSTCQQSTLSPGGACSSTYNACMNNTACNNLLNCLGNCADQTCSDNCWNAAGATAQNLYNDIITCICNTGCPTDCATECSGSSSSGGNCGFQSSDPACDSCLTGKCCAQGAACAANTTCTNCITDATPPTSCNSNSQYVGFVNCLSNNCAAACGISSSSSSSTSSSSGSTSSSSSGSASSSSGSASSSSSTSASSGVIGTGGGGVGGGGTTTTNINTGGAPATGTGANSNVDGSGQDPNQSSGCSVNGASSGSQPGSSGSIAGLLFGIAVAFARRKKSA